MNNYGYMSLSILIIISCFISYNCLIEILFYLQLGGYHFYDVFKILKISITKRPYIYLLVLLGMFINLMMPIGVLAALFLYVICFTICLYGFMVGWQYYKKIRYTKRLLRLLILSMVFIVLYLSLILFLPSQYVFLIVACAYFVVNIVVAIVWLVLCPIEKIISEYYISKAKKKIYSHQSLLKIGITGSYGKTSTKEILNTIISNSYNTFATPKSYNTPLGISKTILSELNNFNEVFICEMGAKRRGEIKYLCNTFGCDYGIITAVGRQHVGTFGSIENIYYTKKELADYLNGRFCVFNLMNRYVYDMYSGYSGEKIGVYVNMPIINSASRIIKNNKTLFNCISNKYIGDKYYAYSKINTLFAKKIICGADGTSFDIYYGNKYLCSANTMLIGIHNVINILLAVGMAIKLNITPQKICMGIGNIKSIKSRLEKFISPGGAVILNNGYNSNIDSCKYTLDTLRLFNCSHRVVITPGLVETDNDYQYNKLFGSIIAKYCTDIVIVKKYNRQALLSGIESAGFDMSRVCTIDKFTDILPEINNATSDYVYLIENDLPDNYI